MENIKQKIEKLHEIRREVIAIRKHSGWANARIQDHIGEKYGEFFDLDLESADLAWAYILDGNQDVFNDRDFQVTQENEKEAANRDDVFKNPKAETLEEAKKAMRKKHKKSKKIVEEVFIEGPSPKKNQEVVVEEKAEQKAEDFELAPAEVKTKEDEIVETSPLEKVNSCMWDVDKLYKE